MKGGIGGDESKCGVCKLGDVEFGAKRVNERNGVEGFLPRAEI